MFFINFSKWSSKHTKRFSIYRKYFLGYIWTPIIKISKRKCCNDPSLLQNLDEIKDLVREISRQAHQFKSFRLS
jgi:hypothetical protein